MPALDADVRLVAARADLVVVRQVDIEDEFLGEGAESGFSDSLAVTWVGGVDRAYFEAGGVEAENLFAESSYVVISIDMERGIWGMDGPYVSEVGNAW